MSKIKEKTRAFYRHMYVTDPFHCYKKYINEDDIDHIINTIFDETALVDKTKFLEELNRVISKIGTLYPDMNTRTPGKTDEMALLSDIYKHNWW